MRSDRLMVLLFIVTAAYYGAERWAAEELALIREVVRTLRRLL